MTTKADIIRRAAHDAGLLPEDARDAINAALEVIAEEIAAGRRVSLAPLGTLKPSKTGRVHLIRSTHVKRLQGGPGPVPPQLRQVPPQLRKES